MNFSRTYDANSSIATYRRSTVFDSLDNIYVGGLPDGAMVRKKKALVSSLSVVNTPVPWPLDLSRVWR